MHYSDVHNWTCSSHAEKLQTKSESTNLVTVLEALLDDVVAEDILHEGYSLGLHLLVYCHYLLCRCICQLLLYEAAAVLIPAKLKHKPLYVLQ